MEDELKKYRVKTVDGGIKYITAKNIHDARSKARIEIGQLPNDINLKVVKKVLDEMDEIVNDLKEEYNNLKFEGKNLDWNNVNSRMKNIARHMQDKSISVSQLAGSMVKIK